MSSVTLNLKLRRMRVRKRSSERVAATVFAYEVGSRYSARVRICPPSVICFTSDLISVSVWVGGGGGAGSLGGGGGGTGGFSCSGTGATPLAGASPACWTTAFAAHIIINPAARMLDM